LIVLSIGLVSSPQTHGQTKTDATDDVVRTKTELVQTDVTVVDKRGRFVEGLSAEDFELRVDSKLQSLSFFEQVRAGGVDEEKQLTAAGKRDTTPNVKPPASVVVKQVEPAVRSPGLKFERICNNQFHRIYKILQDYGITHKILSNLVHPVKRSSNSGTP
jgi:hypothetical protein